MLFFFAVVDTFSQLYEVILKVVIRISATSDTALYHFFSTLTILSMPKKTGNSTQKRHIYMIHKTLPLVAEMGKPQNNPPIPGKIKLGIVYSWVYHILCGHICLYYTAINQLKPMDPLLVSSPPSIGGNLGGPGSTAALQRWEALSCSKMGRWRFATGKSSENRWKNVL